MKFLFVSTDCLFIIVLLEDLRITDIQIKIKIHTIY